MLVETTLEPGATVAAAHARHHFDDVGLLCDPSRAPASAPAMGAPLGGRWATGPSMSSPARLLSPREETPRRTANGANP
jgi:hypothetical protein